MQAVGPVARRRTLIQTQDEPSIRRQCELLEISRTAYYYDPCPETPENLELMRRLDQLHMEHPVYGSRRLAVLLRRQGCAVNRKRIVRLMRVMGIEALYPRGCLSQPGEGHEIFPYLLKEVAINGPNQVWCSDITYIPMQHGFMYLVKWTPLLRPRGAIFKLVFGEGCSAFSSLFFSRLNSFGKRERPGQRPDRPLLPFLGVFVSTAHGGLISSSGLELVERAGWRPA